MKLGAWNSVLFSPQPCTQKANLRRHGEAIGVETHESGQAVMFIGVDHAVSLGRGRIQQTVPFRKHLMVHEGAHKVSLPSTAQQSVEVDVTDPPNDERVRLAAKLGAPQKGDVKEA